MIDGEIEHLSVFAIARLPLAIYLGAQLDDAVATDSYQRHRATDSWIWPDDDPGTTFGTKVARRSAARFSEAVDRQPVRDHPPHRTAD